MARTACFLGIFFYLWTTNVQAQIIDEIKTAGQIYAFAQMHGDQDILLDFTYPELIDKAGGPEAMKRILGQIHQTRINEGQTVKELEIKEPIVYSHVLDEIHALVPIVTTLKVPGGLMITPSTIIAVGTRQRENWYFIETTSIDERNVKKVLPNWDNSLALPFKSPSIFKEDPDAIQ
ncbi:hypothetical protein [Lunatibacter salilacus]|uniref:hypothetical protein n=1 Tax=Lunatibacter salilacus TaxID=2483804 RepID=UPI00131E1E1D|nr:hypothetical protein [Lunatibacter salilacus]